MWPGTRVETLAHAGKTRPDSESVQCDGDGDDVLALEIKNPESQAAKQQPSDQANRPSSNSLAITLIES